MADRPDSTSPRTLKTVQRAFDVVRALQDLDGAGVTELAEELGLSKSSTYNYLSTLREHQYVVKEGDTYRLSYQFLHIGEYVRGQTDIYRHGREELDILAHETGRYVHLATEQHGLGVNLYKVRGEEAIGSRYQQSKLQRPDYLHFSATGKAILAHLPRERVEWILDEYGLVRKTANTITDPEELFAELERTRERGYSVNAEEEIEGIRAVGAPILAQDGEVLGSVSVSGPAHRLRQPEHRERLVKAVTDTANVVEVNIVTQASDDDDFPDFRDA
jgi:DNA-binding IclR family transcriptional regulator